MSVAFRSVFAAGVLSLLTSCGQSSPVRPSPQDPRPGAADPSPDSRPSVSGTVYETAPQGRRPLPGVYLLVTVRVDSGGYGTTIYADGDGRYTMPDTHLVDGGIAAVYADGGAGWFRHQPCVAMTVIKGATTLDVEFNPKDVPGTQGSPTVSGRVYKATSSGRQAVPSRQILYYVRNGLAAHTYTDDDGRYEFCNVPFGPGKVFVTDPFDWELGRPAAEQSLTVTGDIVVDLLITG